MQDNSIQLFSVCKNHNMFLIPSCLILAEEGLYLLRLGLHLIRADFFVWLSAADASLVEVLRRYICNTTASHAK